MCKTIAENELKLLEAGQQPKFNLNDEFRKANQKYFNGELKEVPMSYKRMKNSFGKVRAKVKKRRGTHGFLDVQVVDLLITNVYDMTEEQFLSTFLHELCHLYMLQNFTKYSFRGGYHGYEWKKEAERVSAESGIPITVDESPSGYVPFEDESGKGMKPYVVILMKKPNQDFASVSHTSLSIWNNKGEDWIDKYMTGVNMYGQTDWKFIVLLTTDPRPEQFSRKSIDRPRMYKIDPEIPLDILKNKKYEQILFATR